MFEFKHIEHEQDGKKGNWWEQNKLKRSDFVTLDGYEHYISQSFKGLCISLAINEGAEQLQGSSFTCSNKMLLDLSPRLKKNFPIFSNQSWRCPSSCSFSTISDQQSIIETQYSAEPSALRFSSAHGLLHPLGNFRRSQGRYLPRNPQEQICVLINPENSIHYIHM